jgi:hypothetical protein
VESVSPLATVENSLAVPQKKLDVELPFALRVAILLLGMFPEEFKIRIGIYICMPIFKAALFIVPKRWKQPNIHQYMDG